MLSHGELLSNELRQLELHHATESQSLLASNDTDIPRGEPDPIQSVSSQNDSPQQVPVRPPWPHVREGYGFRPPSGVSTPLTDGAQSGSPLPDPNGLGWPGTLCSLSISYSVVHNSHQPSLPSLVSMLLHQSVLPVRSEWPLRSAPFSNVSAKIQTEKGF